MGLQIIEHTGNPINRENTIDDTPIRPRVNRVHLETMETEVFILFYIVVNLLNKCEYQSVHSISPFYTRVRSAACFFHTHHSCQIQLCNILFVTRNGTAGSLQLSCSLEHFKIYLPTSLIQVFILSVIVHISVLSLIYHFLRVFISVVMIIYTQIYTRSISMKHFF